MSRSALVMNLSRSRWVACLQILLDCGEGSYVAAPFPRCTSRFKTR